MMRNIMADMRIGMHVAGTIVIALMVLFWAVSADARSRARNQSEVVEGKGAFVIVASNTAFNRMLFRAVDKAYVRLGIRTRLELQPGKNLAASVNRGRYDAQLAAVAGIETQYQNLLRIREPLVKQRFAAVFRKDMPSMPGNLASINKDRAVYQRDIFGLEQVFGSSKAFVASNAFSLLRMVEAGRAVYGFSHKEQIVPYLRAFPALVIDEDLLEPAYMHHYLHHRHRHLKTVLEEAIWDLNQARGRLLGTNDLSN